MPDFQPLQLIPKVIKMETIEIVFVVITIFASVYIIKDAINDRSGK